MNQTQDVQRIVADAEVTSRHASSVQEHPGFRTAIARLEAHYIGLLRNSNPNEPEERESAYWMLRALDALKQDIAAAATGSAVTNRNLRNRPR